MQQTQSFLAFAIVPEGQRTERHRSWLGAGCRTLGCNCLPAGLGILERQVQDDKRGFADLHYRIAHQQYRVFQMEGLLAILLAGFVFYFFTSPIGGLGDSLAQRRADELRVSFGTIRTWGSVGFATSSLVVGQILSATDVQYMIWPYLFFGTAALIVAWRLTDVRVESDPVHLKDISALIKNKPFILFLFFIMFITISHRASDSFIGLYLEQLGGNESLVGIAWFVGVISEAAVFALASRWFRKYHTLIFVIFAGVMYTVRWFLYAAANDPFLLSCFNSCMASHLGYFTWQHWIMSQG